ncbi:MAG: ABC transporter ATP-binding protein [Anaerolineae bacterium]|nr:ABC transporter ATP-binding protein [Anaerolineae bacterium]MCI0610986.1 ABC transporter ATP-binding protein [Anaerolineae bacterium]
MLLQVQDIHTYYGLSHILFGVSLEVDRGECVCLVGRNGAGKTTTFKSIMGLAAPRTGAVLWKGQPIQGNPPFAIARSGIGFVPEERAIFPDLTVWENLDVAHKLGTDGRSPWTVERVYEIFPRLEERKNQMGGTLSGGEQQMLTIARTLMGNPDLLLLDEPSEGLAPLIVDAIGELVLQLKQEDVTILLAEQNLHFSLAVSERAYVIDDGRIQFSGTTAELEAHPEIIQKYLAV